MSIVDPKYACLQPSAALLSDTVVLAQAWKKAHNYIRRHNWYSDVLELDCSVLDTERYLSQWANELASDNFVPAPMHVVPAPKNCRWFFPRNPEDTSTAWVPKPKDDGEREEKSPQALRPLAHLGIREQTVMTAAMLCLADAVETLQGFTALEFRAAQQGKVFSYGNRLYCEWELAEGEASRARFGWGSSHTYSQYFQDYERFLRRPAEACTSFSETLKAGRALYVVKLDLRRFFDCVFLPRLWKRLRVMWWRYATQFGLKRAPDENKFWEVLEQLGAWSWSPEDKVSLSDLFEGGLPVGLPQGLVASGLLANAYLWRFDRAVGRRLGRVLDSGEVLRDYCRYVDDLRLVVEADSGQVVETIATVVEEAIQQLLDQYCTGLPPTHRLELNPKKTEVVSFSDFALQGRASEQMMLLQGVLSGTPDPQTLRQATTGLDNLLWLAEVIEAPDEDHGNALALSRIALPRVDVRDDTLKRFAAHRLAKTLRMRRGMVDISPQYLTDNYSVDEATAERALDHEFETTARRLIACWSRNPALVMVLRVGLDLFPSPELLQTVLDAVTPKLRAPTALIAEEERAIAQYVLADLLKAGAVETGFGPEENYPSGCDIRGYRQELERLALDIVEDDGEQQPWFLLQQALLFLAAMRRPLPQPPKGKELIQYRWLHMAMMYLKPPHSQPLRDKLPVTLVAQQLAPAPERFALWLDRALQKATKEDIRQVINLLGVARSDLLEASIKVNGKRKSDWTKHVPDALRLKYYKPGTWSSLSVMNNTWLSLPRVAARADNPFGQENALLSLAKGLLVLLRDERVHQRFFFADLEVWCANWGAVQNPATVLEVRLSPGESIGASDVRLRKPAWCREEMEWAYALGRVLRSCLIGEPDFTASAFVMREELGRYRGLCSSWFKRQFGMRHSGTALSAEPKPISPWLSELVMRLLQWPGLDIQGEWIRGFADIDQPRDLEPLVAQRLVQQQALYGVQSQLPLYVLPTDGCPERNAQGLRVAVVQTLLPRTTDFDEKNPCWWSPRYRRQHRGHLASVCQLIIQHLIAQATARPTQGGKGHDGLDLIVFPELSVHPDDLFLLERLSDATQATICAGLTFVPDGPDGVPINRAVWLIRQHTSRGRSLVRVYQGKQHMTEDENKLGIHSHRPYQVLVEFGVAEGNRYRVSGAICYDATDLALAADLRDVADAFIVAALNRDVTTFDNMVAALNYHMYQPVVLANSGEFGGSTAQAPYRERYDQLIAHVHGVNQAAVSVFDLNLADFKRIRKVKKAKVKKGAPAGYRGRSG